MRNLPGTRHLALLGLIGVVFLLAVGALGLAAAGGAYSDDYELRAVVDRAGFGVDDRSTVKIRGVTVGEVDGIDLRDDGTVDVTLKIRKQVLIPESVEASIEPLSVFGPKFIDLRPGNGEGRGPFLDDGDTIPSTVVPSEVVEILENVSVLLAQVDENDIAEILSEFARGVDGLGDEMGEIITSSGALADLAVANRAALDQLLADARVVAATLDARAGDLVDIARGSQGALDTLVDSEDDVADLLRDTGRLSRELSAVVGSGADDLGRVLDGLDPVTQLLLSQLGQVPDLLDMGAGIFDFIGDDLIQWEIGDGRLGGLVRATIDLDPCTALAIPECI